jgi:hypothetical protein
MGAAGGGGGLAAGGTQILSSKLEADAIKAQGEWQSRQMDFNRAMLSTQRLEIDKKAQEDIVLRQNDVRAMLGAQKVSLAAKGIDVDSDLSKQLQDDTRRSGRLDVSAIENNAWREAWGLQVRETDLKMQSRFARAGSLINSANTIATGGLRAVGYVANDIGKK